MHSDTRHVGKYMIDSLEGEREMSSNEGISHDVSAFTEKVIKRVW